MKQDDGEILEVMAQYQKEKEAEILEDRSVINRATDNAEIVIENLLTKKDIVGDYRIRFE